MKNFLRVDASPRHERSLSRTLGDAFFKSAEHQGCSIRIQRRDLAVELPSLLTEGWIAAAFTPETERSAEQRAMLSQSDEYIAEIEAADVIVICTPMHNYGMPAALKAWVDQIARINKTFSFDLARGDFPIQPALSGKAVVLLWACGEFGFEAGEIRESEGHLKPHVRTIAKYLGVSTFHDIAIEYQEFGDERHERSRRNALAAAEQLGAHLAAAQCANT